jgi:hypothetical protein
MNAYVNYGRWIVDCPDPDCYAALTITDNNCECRDTYVCDHPQQPCGATVQAEMPPNEPEITRLLEQRPRRANRNWVPGETVKDLQAENVQHGIRI